MNFVLVASMEVLLEKQYRKENVHALGGHSTACLGNGQGWDSPSGHSAQPTPSWVIELPLIKQT